MRCLHPRLFWMTQPCLHLPLHPHLHQNVSLKPRRQNLKSVTTRKKTPTVMYWVSYKTFLLLTANLSGVAAKQMKTWTSVVYEHFKLPPTIERKGEEVRYVFVCKKYGVICLPCIWSLTFATRNPSVIVTRVRHNESTSNLIHHADKCTPGIITAAASIAAFAYGSTYFYLKF